VQYWANHRRGSDFNATVQNLTGATITLTFTNQDRITSPTFGELQSGAVTIADTKVVLVSGVISGINFAGTGTGTLEVVEAG